MSAQQQSARGFKSTHSSTSQARATNSPPEAISSVRRSPEYTTDASGPSSPYAIAPHTRTKFAPPAGHPHWGAAAAAFNKQQSTREQSTKQPGFEPQSSKPGEPRDADLIIAELERKANKPKPKAVVPPPPKQISQYQRRPASRYRPVLSRAQKPARLSDYQAYMAWSVKALLGEVSLRRLQNENEDPSYLASILVRHDKEFLQKCMELAEFKTSVDLKEEARLLNIVIMNHDRGQFIPLVEEMADELARRAVSMYNDLMRAEQIAQRAGESHVTRDAQHVRAALPNAPMLHSRRPQISQDAQMKDGRVLEKQPVSETKKQDSGLEKTAVTAVKAVAKKTSAKTSQRTASKPTAATSKEYQSLRSRNVQRSDSAYLSDSGKPSNSPQAQLSPKADDNRELPVVRDSKDSEPTPSRKDSEKSADSKKRSLPVEFEKKTQQTPPKRSKPTLENEVESRKKKAPRARTAPAAASDDGEEMEADSSEPALVFVLDGSNEVAEPTPVKREKVPAKRIRSLKDLAEEEILAAASKTSQKRKSVETDDDNDTEQLPAKAAKRDSSSPGVARVKQIAKGKQPKKLQGIPIEERVPGSVYKALPDGSLKLLQAPKTSRTVTDSARKYIK